MLAGLSHGGSANALLAMMAATVVAVAKAHAGSGIYYAVGSMPAPGGVGDCFARAVHAAAAGGAGGGHGMPPFGGVLGGLGDRVVPVGFRGAQPGGAAFPILGGADGKAIGHSEILACGGRWICGKSSCGLPLPLRRASWTSKSCSPTLPTNVLGCHEVCEFESAFLELLNEAGGLVFSL